MSLLHTDSSSRVSVGDVLSSAEWMSSERLKELPETATTLALASHISRPRVKVEEDDSACILDFQIIFDIVMCFIDRTHRLFRL